MLPSQPSAPDDEPLEVCFLNRRRIRMNCTNRRKVLAQVEHDVSGSLLTCAPRPLLRRTEGFFQRTSPKISHRGLLRTPSEMFRPAGTLRARNHCTFRLNPKQRKRPMFVDPTSHPKKRLENVTRTRDQQHSLHMLKFTSVHFSGRKMRPSVSGRF